jgi:iron complex outermembrane receptor protein
MASHLVHKVSSRSALALLAALLPVVGSSQVSPAQRTTPAAQAKDNEEELLQEVQVTAERYGATVQTTPVAITAITAETLEQRQITNVLQAATEIPGVVIMPILGTQTNARIVMRGAGQENSGINFDQGVGVYIDDIIQPRVTGALFDFFDIGRFEVLRGPQGTLYGRNSSGGALKIESMRPSFNWTGGGEISSGNWNSLSYKGLISGPVVADKLAFSLSGTRTRHDGYLWSTNYNRRIGKVDNSAERIKLLYTPTENLDVWIEGHFIQDYSQGNPGVPLLVAPNVTGTAATGQPRDLTFTENFSEEGTPFLYNNGGSLHVEYRRGPMQFNLISGNGNLGTYSNGGAGGTVTAAQQAAFRNGTIMPAGQNEGRSSVKWYSHELNTTYSTDRFKAVAGLYFYNEKGSSRSLVLESPTIDMDRGVDAWAVFGQGTYSLVNGVGFTLGIRHTEERADFTQYYRLQLAAPQSDSKVFKANTPKFGVDWQITPDILTYASFTKGFKSGGFNPVAPASSIGAGQIGRPVPYNPENVASSEIGLKLTTLGQRLRVNLAAFQAKYTDMQLPQFFPGTTTSYTSNASSATIKGIELEPTWQPVGSFQLYGNMTFTTGEYTAPFLCSLSTTQIIDCSGKHIKALPPRKWTVGFKYSPSLPIPGKLTFNGSWLYTSYFYNNLSNELDIVQSHEANIYNASLGWVSGSGKWITSLDGRNLADKHYVVHAIQQASPTAPAITGYPNPPRTIDLRIGVRY